MWFNPLSCACIVSAIIVVIALTQVSSKPFTHEYECPKCHNGNVKAEVYGSFDQFEHGECSTCGYSYDGLTEDHSD
jgi:Zn ribbon nucleic-acid-binding protein